MRFGQHAEYVRDAGEHPAVAAAPEQLAACLVALAEETAVAEIEFFHGVEQELRGCAELGEGIGRVALVAGRERESDHRGRRHEQRVAPAPAYEAFGLTVAFLAEPERQVYDRRVGEDGIEVTAHRDERRIAGAVPRRPQVALPDRVVVRELEPVAEAPLVRAALREDRFAIHGIARRLREVREAGPEGGAFPAARTAGGSDSAAADPSAASCASCRSATALATDRSISGVLSAAAGVASSTRTSMHGRRRRERAANTFER